MRRWPPSSRTAPCACRATTTGLSPSPRIGRWSRSTRRSSTCCAWRCHQILSMRVPTHAAVDESVELARTVGSRSAVGFTNGVLRTITRSDAPTWRERVLAGAGSGEERLAIEHSHPLWVTRAFRQVLVAEGREAELEPLLVADNVPPRVSLTALPGLAEPEGRTTRHSPVGMVLDGGDPLRLPGVRDGRIRVQDEGSQLAALALSRARPLYRGSAGSTCAPAPAARRRSSPRRPRSAARASWPTSSCRRGPSSCARRSPCSSTRRRCWEIDGTTIGERFAGAFDRILLDAPCTGLGALRRRPEARWRKQPSDVAGLGALQARLLASALDALKPGGLLAYVTCSPHAGETKAVVASVLRTCTRRRTARHTRRAAVDREDAARSARGDARAAVAAPARHRRDVHPVAHQGHCAFVSCPNERAHQSEHPRRGLRQPRAGTRPHRDSRPRARRRHGQPLRAEPHVRSADGRPTAGCLAPARSTCTS